MVIKIPIYVKEILNIINKYGEGYIVGGCVRDSLLGLTPNDWDITTDRMPEEIKEIFKDYKIFNKNGEKHGTVTILYKGKQIEITTYREDKNYLDGRHPSEVSFTRTLKDDLARRDFTINALAYNEITGLVDLYGGVCDLKNGLIKTVGDPYKRFSEDYLRILRGVRFASKLGFKMEKETFVASNNLANKILNYISGERIREELKGILLGNNVLDALIRFHNIIFSIIPELKICYKFNQNNPYHIHDVYTHLCYVTSYTKKDFTTRLAALLHDIGKPNTYTYEYKQGRIWGHFYGHPEMSYQIAKPILDRLKLSTLEKEEVMFLIKEHDSEINPNKRVIKRLIMRTPNEDKLLIYKLLDLKTADRLDHINIPNLDIIKINEMINTIYLNKEALKITDLDINGNDLIKLGYRGKKIGDMLSCLLELVIDDKLENKHDVLIKYINKLKDKNKLY